MASESSFVQLTIPKFDGHYDHCSMLMKEFSAIQGILGIGRDWDPCSSKKDGSYRGTEKDNRGS
jgi:hypothetical protein